MTCLSNKKRLGEYSVSTHCLTKRSCSGEQSCCSWIHSWSSLRCRCFILVSLAQSTPIQHRKHALPRCPSPFLLVLMRMRASPASTISLRMVCLVQEIFVRHYGYMNLTTKLRMSSYGSTSACDHNFISVAMLTAEISHLFMLSIVQLSQGAGSGNQMCN